ncbi:MAG: hypothetical protein OXG82_00185 [Gammaproteobacteria bacterium]|nr:hypothetical protein [Gammaproteobacteria bacterium]
MADDGSESNAELRERIRSLTEELGASRKNQADLEQELAAAETDRTALREEVASHQEDAATARTLASEAIDTATVAQQRSRDAVDTAAEAVRRRDVAEKKLGDATEQLRQKSETEKLSEMERAARAGLRDFVRDSLSDIMVGVDEAATLGRARDVGGGLGRSGFVSLSRIGDVVGEGKTEVQFDLALIANAEEVEKRSKERRAGGEISTGSILQVLGLTAKVSAGGSSESGAETKDSTSQHNRIRFSVPVVFASQTDKLE